MHSYDFLVVGGGPVGCRVAYKLAAAGHQVAVLEKNGVERIATVGQPFDPAVHEAVAVIPRKGVEENIVLEEVRPGFKRNGRLLRPAMVVVAQ